MMLIAFVFSVTQAKNKINYAQNNIVQQEDKEILKQIFSLFADDSETPMSELMVDVGIFFKETPYVAFTLEIDSVEENLVINLREMDCTTFAENCLAISRTIKSGEHTIEKFANELQKIRYRNGEIDGYVSRLHYFSDWIFDNNKKQVIKSISKEIGGVPYSKQINFMSTHPRSYIQLKNNPKLVQEMVLFEKVISERKVYFIKKENLSQFEPLLQEGDIVGITTGITGLDVVHVGILVKKSGRIHLLHASSDAKKVVVSQNTLEDYLLQNKSATGVILARPLDSNTP